MLAHRVIHVQFLYFREMPAVNRHFQVIVDSEASAMCVNEELRSLHRRELHRPFLCSKDSLAV